MKPSNRVRLNQAHFESPRPASKEKRFLRPDECSEKNQRNIDDRQKKDEKLANKFSKKSFFRKCAQMYQLTNPRNKETNNLRLLKHSSKISETLFDYGNNGENSQFLKSNFNRLDQQFLKKKAQIANQNKETGQFSDCPDDQMNFYLNSFKNLLILDDEENELLEKYNRTHSDYVKALENPIRVQTLVENFNSFYSAYSFLNLRLNSGSCEIKIGQRNFKNLKQSNRSEHEIQQNFKIMKLQNLTKNVNSLHNFPSKSSENKIQLNLFKSPQNSQQSPFKPEANLTIKNLFLTKSETFSSEDATKKQSTMKSTQKTVPVVHLNHLRTKRDYPPNQILPNLEKDRMFNINSAKWKFSDDQQKNQSIFNSTWTNPNSSTRLRSEPSRGALAEVAHLVWFEEHVPMFLVRRLNDFQRWF